MTCGQPLPARTWSALAAVGVACALIAAACQRQGQSQGAAETQAPSPDWADPIRVAAGDGHRGPWRMNESDWRFVDDGTVAINDEGVIAVAWADHVKQDVLLQVFEPNGDARFAEPKNISRSSDVFSWLPRIELGAGGAEEVFILWQEIVFSGGSHGGEIFFSRSLDGGERFEEPANLSQSRAGAGKGRLTRDRWNNGSFDLLRPDGGETLYAAWTEYEGRLWLTRSGDRGESFAEPIALAGGDAGGEPPARGPSLAAAPDGEMIYLAYAVGEDPSANIQLATSTDAGASFGDPVTVAAGSGHADAPEIATTKDGTLHLVFAESERGMFRDYDVFYTRRNAGEPAFEDASSITGDQGEEHGSLHFPNLEVDDDDRLYASWELYPSPQGRPRGLGFAAAQGGQDFGDPQVVPSSDDAELGLNGSQQGLLMRKLAASSGRIAIAHSTFRPGENSAIWLYHAER